MRWIVGLVTSLCLLAATSVRPDDPRAREQSQLVAAHHAAASASVRRSAPDLRLAPFALPVVPAVKPPRAASCAGVVTTAIALRDAHALAPRSRGPPRG